MDVDALVVDVEVDRGLSVAVRRIRLGRSSPAESGAPAKGASPSAVAAPAATAQQSAAYGPASRTSWL